MQDYLFDRYDTINKVDDEIIEKYNEILPVELITVWRRYGFGSMLNGYLKIINPDEYIQIIQMSYATENVSIPILITAFGDIVTWEENKYIGIIRYKKGVFQIISSGFKYLFNDLQDEYFKQKYLEIDTYNEAIRNIGLLERDECFGYVPLLMLGGSEKVENLKKVKIKEHIKLISQMIGKIGDDNISTMH